MQSFRQSASSSGQYLSQAYALLSLRGVAYPDLIDPLVQGAKLVSMLVEDGLLQLLVLKQSLQEANLG